MNCDRVREIASDSLDGVLAEDVEERFHEHLANCTPCRVFFADLRNSLMLLEELAAVEVGEDFNDHVFAKIRAGVGLENPWVLWRDRFTSTWQMLSGSGALWRWSPVGAAVIVLGIFAAGTGPVPSQEAFTESEGSTPRADAFEKNEELMQRVAQQDPSGRSRMLSRVGTDEARGFAETVDPFESNEEEFLADIPEAVEAYLRNARDLRLQKDSDRLRRSYYSYPLRRVEDPSLTPVMGPSLPRNNAVQIPGSLEPQVEIISF